MTNNPNNLPLLQFIANTAPELVTPIETVQRQLVEAGEMAEEDVFDGLYVLYIGFISLGLQLASSDGYLAAKEVDLLLEIRRLLVPDQPEHLASEARNLLREIVRKAPEQYSEVDVPGTVGYLYYYDEVFVTDYAAKAKAMYFRFANAMVKADGHITKEEKAALAKLKELFYPSTTGTDILESQRTHSGVETISIAEMEARPADQLLEQLRSLIGLDAVKNDVTQLVNFLKVQQLRQSKGMATAPVSRHLVFSGNPGTGKTTVARLLSQIYRSLNILSKGHLIETDRSGLVAGYVGQTALKVKEVVNSALGGILFIDEAYSLFNEGQDYGREAVDTLIKLMEDNREDLIVVVAGYTEKMHKFLLSNPGLKSRFNKYLYFADYSPPQLLNIFQLFCKNAGFCLAQEAEAKALGIFQVLHEVRDETFGNARLARNVFERAISNQANRIIALSDIDEGTLAAIEAVDLPGDVELHSLQNIHQQ